MTIVRVGNVISRKDALHSHPAAQGILDDAAHADSTGRLEWMISTAKDLGLADTGVIAPDTGQFGPLSEALDRLKSHLRETGAPLLGIEPEATTVNLRLYERLRSLARDLAALTEKDPVAADGFAARARDALDEAGDSYTGHYERYVSAARDIADEGGGIASIHRQAWEDGAPPGVLDRIKEQALRQARWATGEPDYHAPF